jgi:hypothetical protein
MWSLLVVAGVVVVVAAVFVVRWWVWSPLVRKRVVVQCDGAAFNGVVMCRRGPLLVLDDVTVSDGSGHLRTLDGRLVVERSRVRWVQVL